jgi:hypothetical protein
MTAEKHPLETVRELINEVLTFNSAEGPVGRRIVPALNILNTYMGQTQSCAECERLGRENADLRLEVRDFGAVYGGVDDWGDKLAEVQEKHAATIAAAGGE